jgi:glycosyltransferase involved in cell wall biosynthesis
MDETSSYGTFPLEAMKSGVPVLGLVPNMVPSWMSEDNGIWINNKIQMVDFVADYLQNWLEDNINPSMIEEMLKTVENLSTKEEFEKVSVSLFEGYINKRVESFEEQLSKLQTIE